jgi:hypothetical protein
MGNLALDAARAESVMARRVADHAAPPPVRGAAMGFLWSMREVLGRGPSEEEAVKATRSAARPSTLGDFLVGLFALAREEVLGGSSEARELLRVVDGLVLAMTDEDFLVAAPSLRLAFAYFPPREKEQIAKSVLALHAMGAEDARQVLRLEVDPGVVMQGMRIDREVGRVALRFGLAGDEEEP